MRYVALFFCVLMFGADHRSRASEAERPSAALFASPKAAESALMEADRAFAAATAQYGLEGWMSFYTADAARLRMGEAAVRGHASIRRFDAPLFADTTTRLVWAPTDAGVFDGDDYGFTTGRAAMLRVASGDTLWQGQYITIWRHEGDTWKVILDTGS